MKGWFGMTVALALAVAPGAVDAAMNWCALQMLIPTQESDFERIAPLVLAATGCARRPTSSAHDAEWMCEDEPTTDANERTIVRLYRVPGEGVQLLVASWGLQSLDTLRACRPAGMSDGRRFEPGNVAHRDEVFFDFKSKRLTLINLGADSVSMTYSSRPYGSDDFAKGLVSGMLGVDPVMYPTTAVKLAGLDPLKTDVFDLVAAYEKRGSRVQSSKDLATTVPEWTLSPPVGLPGVTRVEVVGFVRHLLNVKYVMAGTPDYERFVGLLDAEYGTSTRSSDEGCTIRHWSAGRVSVTGRHCSATDSRLIFYNEVASDQLSSIVDKRKADEKAEKARKPDEPTIDRDNF